MRTLGDSLRAARLAAGLTLADVEIKTDGHVKAVAAGSYERGHRGVSLPRLHELAAAYGVRAVDLIPPLSHLHAPSGSSGDPGAGAAVLRLDLARLRALDPETAGPLGRYAHAIVSHQPGAHREILTLRRADAAALAVIYGCEVADLIARLADLGVLRAALESPAAVPRRRRGRPRREADADPAAVESADA